MSLVPYTALRQFPDTAARRSRPGPLALTPEEFSKAKGYTEDTSRVVTAMPSIICEEGLPMPGAESGATGVSTSSCTSTVRLPEAVAGSQLG